MRADALDWVKLTHFRAFLRPIGYYDTVYLFGMVFYQKLQYLQS
jgi:hypothetical protein